MQESTLTQDEIDQLYKKIGLKVKQFRTEKGLSQLELALAIGHKAVGTVSTAEIYTNKKHFNIEHLAKIAERFVD